LKAKLNLIFFHEYKINKTRQVDNCLYNISIVCYLKAVKQ